MTTAPARFKSLIKAVFDVASYVAAGNRKLVTGATFEKILGRYYSGAEVGHWLVRNEAPTSLAFPRLALGTGAVEWLTAWPVTSDELVLLEESGSAGIGRLLDEAGLLAFDLDRGSLEGVPRFDPWAEPSSSRR